MATIKICLDPGHGGKDPGAVGPSGLKEATVALDVCKKVSSLLSGDFDVILTRTADTTTELITRSNLANREKAYILVSVHCNAAANRTAHGAETYCYKFGGNGEKLAKAIQKHLVSKSGLFNRGVKTGNLHMVRETKMPACLVELAFISNPTEEKLLRSEDFKNACAIAIAQGIAEYFGKELNNVEPTKVLYKGKKLEGFIREGKTFVEVRELCSAFGKKVEWNSKDKIVEVKD